jgi:ketosteroid isomerase-like protein
MTEVKALARSWLDMVATGRFEVWAEIVDDEFVLRLPYAPPGTPEELRGLAARDALVGSLADQERFEWMDVVITATEDPELLVITARSEVALKSGGTYANSYVMLTRARGDKLVEHVEYFNPLPVLERFRQ